MEDIKEMTIDRFIKKKFFKVRINDPIDKIIKIFGKGKISVIPVMKGKKFVGEIHVVDLLKLLVDMKDVPEEDVTSLGFTIDTGYIAKNAKDIMRSHEVVLEPSTKVKDAAFNMLKKEVAMIPVMKDNSLLGILTERKLLEEFLKRGNV